MAVIQVGVIEVGRVARVAHGRSARGWGGLQGTHDPLSIDRAYHIAGENNFSVGIPADPVAYRRQGAA
jgi:hypothetical protein